VRFGEVDLAINDEGGEYAATEGLAYRSYAKQRAAVRLLLAAVGCLPEARKRGLAVPDGAEDQSRHLRGEEDDRPVKIYRFLEELVLRPRS
jgi:hypothetical protein